MRFAYELNPRQSSRVFEQAVRSGVTIRLDPHYSSGLEPFAVQLIDEDKSTLTFRILDEQAGAAEGLVPGMYCQGQFSLGGVVYLFSTYIIDFDEHAGWICTARPETIQILERRKFVRTRLASSSPVLLRWPERDKHAIADLLNIGGEGMAFRVPRRLADELLIGENIELEFDLPGLKRHFRFMAIICNKTPASSEEKVIIGVQFRIPEDDSETSEALEELRRFLVAGAKTSTTK